MMDGHLILSNFAKFFYIPLAGALVLGLGWEYEWISKSALSFAFFRIVLGWLALSGGLYIYFEALKGRVMAASIHIYRKNNPKAFKFWCGFIILWHLHCF